jgi:hypothetical protein
MGEMDMGTFDEQAERGFAAYVFRRVVVVVHRFMFWACWNGS